MLAEYIQLPKEGETVGPYLLRQVLSMSILGNFYLATHRLRHVNVLLHIMPEAILRADARFQQRYKESIARQSRMPRCAAMAVEECSRVSGNLVVQYPAGNYKSLNEVVLDREQPLPEQRVRELLAQLGKGLAEAAKVGLGHFFMSPDFLFLNEDGELRIAGIGLFQSIQYESFERFVSGAVIPVTADKSRSFTALEILSPEIRNFKTPDLRSDFYCIGMCAYFMLTGAKPERRWATPTKARKEIGEGWDLFISHCLEPRPADRFPNYKAFLRDLEHIDELTSETRREGGGLMRTLNRIPLPETFERLLSLRFLMVMRLALLGLAGVLAVGTASIFYQIIFEDFETEVTDKPIHRLSDPAKANLLLTVYPRDATVNIRGPESGRFNPGDEPLLLRARRGRYTLQVTAPSHRMVSRQIDIAGAEPLRETFLLRPDFASVRVSGAAGTDVYAVQQGDFLLYLGTITAPDGLLIDDRLLRGPHTLIGYHDALLPAATGTLALTGLPVAVTLDQPPRPTELVVNSRPGGATVRVDGRVLGVTPLRAEELAIGRPLEVQIDLEGYRTVRREIEFGKGQRITIDTGDLEPRIGTLRYTIDLAFQDAPDMRELMLSIDDEPRLVAAEDSIDLPEGPHVLRVEHPDFIPFVAEVGVLDRAVSGVNVRLEPRPIRLLPLIDTDTPARFLVDGQETQLTSQGYLPVPAGRPAKVEVVIRDFLNVIQWFNGRPNERQQWRVPLKPIPGPQAGQDWTPPYFDLPMVWVDPGTFTMGSPIDEFRRLPNEDTTTEVRLGSGFWIGAIEVTQDLFERVMRANPSQFKDPRHPVESVSWEQAVEFCRRLSDFEARSGRLPPGYSYRLPTEAEWEYAARAGTRTAFAFGDSADPSRGNFHGTYSTGQVDGKSAENRYGTMPVGSFPANPFGLHDVHGNVAEWTLDRFWDRHPGGSVTDPINTGSGRGYTIRGGSWRDTADRVRSAAREGATGSAPRNSIGFRVVLAPSPAAPSTEP